MDTGDLLRLEAVVPLTLCKPLDREATVRAPEICVVTLHFILAGGRFHIRYDLTLTMA